MFNVTFKALTVRCYAHWNVCMLLPTIIIVESRCEDPTCRRLHALGVGMTFLWVSLEFEWEFK